MTTARTTPAKERPILFSGPMVRAILDGRKTQTRRVAKLGPRMMEGEESDWCPYGQPGDRLWVKETFRIWDHSIGTVKVEYLSGEPSQYVEMDHRQKREIKRLHQRDTAGKKLTRPSIFMPRWASRITLELTAVRVERLQEISEEDCQAEGVKHDGIVSYYCEEPTHNSEGAHRCNWRAGYSALWDSINGKTHPWKSNPWVWVLEFRRIMP